MYFSLPQVINFRTRGSVGRKTRNVEWLIYHAVMMAGLSSSVIFLVVELIDRALMKSWKHGVSKAVNRQDQWISRKSSTTVCVHEHELSEISRSAVEYLIH